MREFTHNTADKTKKDDIPFPDKFVIKYTVIAHENKNSNLMHAMHVMHVFLTFCVTIQLAIAIASLVNEKNKNVSSAW